MSYKSTFVAIKSCIQVHLQIDIYFAFNPQVLLYEIPIFFSSLSRIARWGIHLLTNSTYYCLAVLVIHPSLSSSSYTYPTIKDILLSVKCNIGPQPFIIAFAYIKFCNISRLSDLHDFILNLLHNFGGIKIGIDGNGHSSPCTPQP